MADMPKLEKHLRKFEDNERRRLSAARALRLAVRKDMSLPELERVVLGITGSAEELAAAQQRADLVIENLGEPIVVVDRAAQLPFLRATGGIICGSMTTAHSFTALSGSRGHSGHVKLEVPVIELVSTHDGMIFHGKEGTLDEVPEAVTVDHFISQESDNTGFEPRDDYTNYIDKADVYIGRRALYSEFDTRQAADFLAAIEQTAPRIPLSE
jgi:hypothetical protein